MVGRWRGTSGGSGAPLACSHHPHNVPPPSTSIHVPHYYPSISPPPLYFPARPSPASLTHQYPLIYPSTHPCNLAPHTSLPVPLSHQVSTPNTHSPTLSYPSAPPTPPHLTCAPLLWVSLQPKYYLSASSMSLSRSLTEEQLRSTSAWHILQHCREVGRECVRV